MTWSRSKANLLRSIWRANRMNRIMRINDFNRRDIAYFQARGLIELGERGPVLTDKGITKLENSTVARIPHKPQHLANSALTHTAWPL